MSFIVVPGPDLVADSGCGTDGNSVDEGEQDEHDRESQRHRGQRIFAEPGYEDRVRKMKESMEKH
jgi:hypothetical protein